MYINSDIYSRFSSHHSRKHIYNVNNRATKAKTKEKINIPVVISSAAGTLIPLAIIAKKQNTSLLKVELDKLKYILPVGIGSVLGGLAGGIATDKDKDHWKKIKEANYQIITNIVTPMIIVNKLLQIAEKSKKLNKTLAKCLAVATGLGIGVTIGTFISDIVNNKIIKKGENYKRQVKPKDFIVHVDDISAALALSKIPFIDKVIPFCFTAAGYEVGSKK